MGEGSLRAGKFSKVPDKQERLAGNREVTLGEGERGETEAGRQAGRQAGAVYFWSQRSEDRSRCNLVKPL